MTDDLSAMPAPTAGLSAMPAPRETAAAPSAGQRPVRGSMDHLYHLINEAGKHGVSDIHVVPKQGVWFVTQGKLRKESSPSFVFEESHIKGWLDKAGELQGKDFEPLGDRGHTSVAFDTGVWRVRASFRKTTGGVTVTFRLIPGTVPNADEMNVPQQIQDLINYSAGLILIEGPTGSGKTTLIASLIDKINRETDQHVYLIEDPIEFVHTPQGNSIFTQREIGVHAKDFPSSIENALRSKPNVIVVGELLNPATAKAALHAATTGHLVITTAHAGSVTEAIDSFIGQFTADEQPQIRSRLSQSLLAIVVQLLVPKIGGGLVPIREIMLNDLNFAELIGDGTKSNMIHQSMDSTKGCTTLEMSLADLVQAQIVSAEVAISKARKPAALKLDLEMKGLI